MHIDDYIDHERSNSYISFFFHLQRLRASLKIKYEKELEDIKLFCTYKNKRYQVIGASAMGDVFLRKLNCAGTYHERDLLETCTQFSKTATFDAPEELPLYEIDSYFV